jgi:hypothetical protein
VLQKLHFFFRQNHLVYLGGGKRRGRFEG